MKIFVQSVNFNADKELVSYVEDKVMSLEKFYDKIIDAEVFLKVQQTSDKENKAVEVKINVTGAELIVKKSSKTFEEGVTKSLDSMKRQLNKHKEKQRAHHA